MTDTTHREECRATTTRGVRLLISIGWGDGSGSWDSRQGWGRVRAAVRC
jgi:hypothetical protein